MYLALKALGKDRPITKADKKHVAALLETSLTTVRRIWTSAKEQERKGKRIVEVDVSNKKKGDCGRKTTELGLSRVRSIELNKRSTLRGLARELNVAYSTLQRRIQWGGFIRRHTNTIKPALKPENKIARLKFCTSMIDQRTTADDQPSFLNMENIVHIDEKWFDMTKRKRTYYLLYEEEDPVRTIHNTHSIGKVMFLTAVAKPRYDEKGNVTFDGKIGVWAFVKETPAKNDSKNRLKGTMETKSVTVTRDVMREYICEKVVPSIAALWPDKDGTIYTARQRTDTHTWN